MDLIGAWSHALQQRDQGTLQLYNGSELRDVPGMSSHVLKREVVEVLHWARSNGCEWDDRTCGAAAFHGQLEILQWALANGCPWSEYAGSMALEGGHDDVIEWLKSNNYAVLDLAKLPGD